MNYKDFSNLWDTVVIPEVGVIQSSNSGLIFADYLKDDIAQECIDLVNHGKTRYMRDSSNFLDRHKIAAAVIISILKNTPIKTVGANYYTVNAKTRAFNEELAITCGLSVLRSFIISDLQDKFEGQKLDNEIKKIDNGIKLPETRHGNYRANWNVELYYTRKDGN